jgi:hypothetical protein
MILLYLCIAVAGVTTVLAIRAFGLKPVMKSWGEPWGLIAFFTLIAAGTALNIFLLMLCIRWRNKIR